MKSNKLTLDDVAEFTWSFSALFLLETSKGNFTWSDPSYGGDNTIRPYSGNPNDFTMKGLCGGWGTHVIRKYCGDDVKILDDES